MAMVTRWEPINQLWREMQQFQHDLGRAFQHFDVNVKNWPGLATSFPALNLWEDGECVYAEAELPGMKMDDLEIYVTGDQLTLKGKREAPQIDKATWHRQERGFGVFTRVVTLPIPVDADKVEAKFEHGILTIKLPKAEAAKPKKIAIKAD